ncbi:MAG: hypothetical protein IPN71_09715 [Fibrobacteres bacterium]|nr:hypothetical protein [Fibrobacterota bacterium]
MRRGFLLISSFLIVFLAACRDPDLDHAREFLQLEDWRAPMPPTISVCRKPRKARKPAWGWPWRVWAGCGSVPSSDWTPWRNGCGSRDLAIVERLDSNQNTRGELADALYHGSLWLQSHSQSARAEAVARMAQNVDPDHAPSAQF